MPNLFYRPKSPFLLSTSLAQDIDMMDRQFVSNIKNFVSKRSNRNALLFIVSTSFVMGLFNSSSLPVSFESAKKLQKFILQGFVISQGPKEPQLKDKILNDFENRISDEFKIPDGLRSRVGFWFDIYSKYDSNKKVIHHSRYPWIIFKVVDVTDIINSDTPRVRWLRNVKAEKFVAKELEGLKHALREISQNGRINPENETEVQIEAALSEILEGSLKNKARTALESLRIQTGQKNFFADGLKTSPLYLPEMEAIFKKYKLPTELTRLPFVESSFNRHAVSKVGASGIWQFMDYTGKNFLTVTEHIDERNSPFKSTEAAARLLKENHMILHKSWPLAITAWNHGPGGVRRAIKAIESKEISDIVNGYQSKTFDFASSNFYAEFLAALYTEKYHEKLFEGIDYEKNLELHKVQLSRSVKAQELVRHSGLAKENFILFNPDLKKAVERNVSIPSGFKIMIDNPTRLTLKNLISKSGRETRVSKLSEGDLSFNSGTDN